MISKGHVVITTELLQKLLELPEDVLISGINYESNRDLVRINLHSHEPVEGVTWETHEGSETRRSDLARKLYELVKEGKHNVNF